MRDKPELVLEIDGLVIDTYHSATITLMLASVASTFTFDVYRDESINKYFRPGANHRCKVKMLNQSKQEYETLITGYVVGADLHAKKVPDYERLSGYSLTGILEYAPIPPDFESLQFKGESLYSICKRITDYYGLTIKVKEGAEQKSYEIYTAENVLAPTKNKEAKGESSEYLRELQAGHRETCSSFMSKLATERGITVSHDNEGNLLLYHIVETIPVRAEIDEKTSIYHHINLNASWHQMYSKSVAILEMKETEMETTEAVMRAEAINPLYKGVRLQNGEYRHIVQEKEEQASNS